MAERTQEIRPSGLKRIAPPMGRNTRVDFGHEGVDRQNFPKDSGPFMDFVEGYITPVDTTETPDWLPPFNSDIRTKRK